MASNYFLLFKTAQAEFRAWEALSKNHRRSILPIVEITRGRKKPNAGKGIPKNQLLGMKGIYGFSENIRKIRDSFSDCDEVIFDLTREEELSSFEIDQLFQSRNGYLNWVEFLLEEKSSFQKIIPTILVNPADGEEKDQYKKNIISQLEMLMDNFSGVSYRASVLLDPDFIYDLLVLKDRLNEYINHGKSFWIELDHEFIRPGTGILHAARTVGLIEEISKIVPGAQVVVLSTSFPRSIEELGDPENDSFPIEEVFLYDEIAKIDKTGLHLIYGDYGSINPVRNDLVVARGGWRPRIDFPTSRKRTFYYREKREKYRDGSYSSYRSHYTSVAKKVMADPMFEDLSGSWGVKQIKQAATTQPPASAPSFWISVRMEIHILQQLKRLLLS